MIIASALCRLSCLGAYSPRQFRSPSSNHPSAHPCCCLLSVFTRSISFIHRTTSSLNIIRRLSGPCSQHWFPCIYLPLLPLPSIQVRLSPAKSKPATASGWCALIYGLNIYTIYLRSSQSSPNQNFKPILRLVCHLACLLNLCSMDELMPPAI